MRRPVVNRAASVRARLLRIAQERRLAFDLVLTRYALERVLYRLACSAHADRFVLKGAMLLATWFDDPLRATRDLDLLGFGDADADGLIRLFAEVLAIDEDDGLALDVARLRAEPIREDQAYGGVRLRTTATLAAARIPIVIDIGFGDAVEPNPQLIDYPTLLDLPRPRLRAYAPETVVAEKFQAMVALGRANTRMKDFYDLWLLATFHAFDDERLARALAATFARRETALPQTLPDALTLGFAEDLSKRRQWAAFTADLPGAPSLGEVVAVLADFLMPSAQRAQDPLPAVLATSSGGSE